MYRPLAETVVLAQFAWHVALAGISGLRMTGEQVALYRDCTGREAAPRGAGAGGGHRRRSLAGNPANLLGEVSLSRAGRPSYVGVGVRLAPATPETEGVFAFRP